MSIQFSSVLIWTILTALTFGFCSIWCLHFVAMLACELDLPIGINVPLTLLSAILAVLFTFAALGSDLLRNTYQRGRRKRRRRLARHGSMNGTLRRSSLTMEDVMHDASSSPLLGNAQAEAEDDYRQEENGVETPMSDGSQDGSDRNMVFDVEEAAPTGNDLSPTSTTISPQGPTFDSSSNGHPRGKILFSASPELPRRDSGMRLDLGRRRSSEQSFSQQSDSIMGSNLSTYGLGHIMSMAYRSTAPAKNAFIATGEALYAGCTIRNIIKGFAWSLAITSMHYSGIAALKVPEGHLTLNPLLVILSGLISWIVCLVGCILMSQIETHFSQQLLFAAVASTGVAAMHFTGMWAATFWSTASPSPKRGYPPGIAIAVVSIAIITCIAANFLLAHVATVSRDKLAEIVLTRKELWKTIALKENAEAAAAAKSDFIASASHEIRTPLHHLQGYSDLLARTELTEEGRTLLYAIQHATKTLSLITNNVLDWSKLEKNTEDICRPIALDMRSICESTLMLLPNKDDEAEVDLLVVVSPSVPHSLFLDETYVQRILMNLLFNALKFTPCGYVLLLVEMRGDKLTATVKDTGSGIPPSFLPDLFEPFKQATTRGSQRGTGLGMSIVKQLLARMNGKIEVESQHTDSAGIGPDETGSTFTITIPAPPLGTPICENRQLEARPQVAVFDGNNERAFGGLCTAWENADYDVVRVRDFTELSGSDWKYIWADVKFLMENAQVREKLLDQEHWTVLVPYDSQEALQHVPGLLASRNCMPLQKPLVWHSFLQRIATAGERQTTVAASRTVRFAPRVDIVSPRENEQSHARLAATDYTVLLVEDNPINQKLGKKMLMALKYQVITAEDGEQAIQQILQHDAVIDAILMDQSMPVKDGVTATKEIRAMEEAGTLSRRRPIIAVTAVVSPEAQELFKSAGADDFLTKPLALGKLGQTLSFYLSQDAG